MSAPLSERPAALLALDWGTSTLRGALLDAQGQVLDQRRFDRGILNVAPGAFAAVFMDCFGDWAQQQARRCLICGMAGSRQGWQEAPYAPCPADPADIARRVQPLQAQGLPLPVALVPGLSCMHPDPALDAPGLPDVMRGEETQVLGALRLQDAREGVFVLPGTHSKWVQVRDGRILGFRTAMTGELYGLLARQSLLARTVDPDAALDADAFLEGLRRARAGDDLLHQLFGVRTLSLFGRRSAPALASHLSGLLIGSELRSRGPLPPRLTLVGSPALRVPYRLALAACGVDVTEIDEQATWAGLHAIAQAWGATDDGR